jgi:hypothetical protein
MKKLMTGLFLGVFSLAVNAAPTFFGMVSLSEQKDRDVLFMPACASFFNNSIHFLRLTVTNAPAEINFLKVHFQNGTQEVLNVREYFSVGSSSRWIDLRGGNRCISKIVVIGDAETPRYRPYLESKIFIYGM